MVDKSGGYKTEFASKADFQSPNLLFPLHHDMKRQKRELTQLLLKLPSVYPDLMAIVSQLG